MRRAILEESYRFPEFGTRPMNPGFDRADRQLEYSSDLVIGQTPPFPKQNQHSKVPVDSFEGMLQQNIPP